MGRQRKSVIVATNTTQDRVVGLNSLRGIGQHFSEVWELGSPMESLGTPSEVLGCEEGVRDKTSAIRRESNQGSTEVLLFASCDTLEVRISSRVCLRDVRWE